MLAAQNSNISIIPKEVVLLVFLSKKKLSSSGTQLRSDLLLSILKSFAFSERLSKYEGHTKLLLPASETPEENTAEWAKCLIAHLLSLVSQATHFASLFQFFFCERIFFFLYHLGILHPVPVDGFFPHLQAILRYHQVGVLQFNSLV